MPLIRARPRNVSSSNHSFERWVPKQVSSSFDLARQCRCGHGHVDIGLADVAVPLRNLVFEDVMIAERIPGQPADLPMILMRVVLAVGEDEIGIADVFRFSNHS